jgi:hypothetical protein
LAGCTVLMANLPVTTAGTERVVIRVLPA